MKSKKPNNCFELKNSYSFLKLPILCQENSPGNEEKSHNKDILEITKLLKDIKLNEHRTTNFASILYIEENKFKKIPIETIRTKIRNDYNTNKNILVNSKNNSPFDSEVNLIKSLNLPIRKNKAFMTEKINGQVYISHNKQKALDYLKKIYKKYTNTKDGDIASLASGNSRKQLSLKNDSFAIELMKIKEIKGKSKK